MGKVVVTDFVVAQGDGSDQAVHLFPAEYLPGVFN